MWKQTCIYRKWELIGIPCRHDELDIYKSVHKVYWLDTWNKAYLFKMEPIKRRSIDFLTKLIPPPQHTQVGRPKKKRRQNEGERLSKKQRRNQGDGVKATQEEGSHRPTNDGVQKLSRKHISVTCSKRVLNISQDKFSWSNMSSHG
uniref:Uncharacterized protein n=1 Tax=Lactuca sativa TaxID=4236 RepID=A0A9R1V3J1_LACSA|nr:hypothetical protein LSAT_V11C700376550 [Lactuca sativa]